MLLALSFLLLPSAQASSAVLVAFDLPLAARDLRHDGIPDSEVRAVIVGSRERHLHCDEIHEILVTSHKAILVNGPVAHYDDVMLVELDQGVRGPDLVVYIDDYYDKHGYKHGKDDVVIVGPGWGGTTIHLDNGHEKGHWDNGKHGEGHSEGHGEGHGESHGKSHGKGHDK